MKAWAQLDPYEVLELARGASRAEVERAYRLALETYAEDSLAGYSVVGAADAAALRERMHDAYRTLADAEARAAYDATGEAGAAPEPSRLDDPEPMEEAFDGLEEGESEWTGARLRRQRLGRGRELDEIAAVTKVNPTYLRFLEDERFAELPARVYVRGFVFSYATCLGLDAESVAHGYMRRFDAGRPSGRRRHSR